MPSNPTQQQTNSAVTDPSQDSAQESLEQRARQLAQRHAGSSPRAYDSSVPLLERLGEQQEFLQHAYQTFVRTAQEEPTQAYAAEWLLDNFHIAQQAMRQVQEDMPGGYYRQLPKLKDGPLQDYPRIYALAVDLIQATDARVEVDRLWRYITAYQETVPLTMGELWALPTMLRLGILTTLTQALAHVLETSELDSTAKIDLISGPQHLPPDTVVANCILSLRTLSVQDWKAFFESASVVEQILSRDPAHVYHRTDFETRDQYRQVIEDLALVSGHSEKKIAEETIKLARHAPVEEAEASRLGHVGYYLIDQGYPQLEKQIDYRPAWPTRLRRWFTDRPTLFYLGGIGLLTSIVLLALILYARAAGATLLQTALTFLLTLIPALTIAVSLVNWSVTNLLPPSLLPKLDFREGVPADFKTMVVIPAMLTSDQEVRSLLRQLELHFLRNSDPQIHFALLTDFADAPEEHMPDDRALLEQAQAGIQALNQRYTRQTPGPFYLFHRERRWNPKEGVWMGWERKRGKIEEFNQRLLGKEETSYVVELGDLEVLSGIRYIITLDADTILPKGNAHRLIGTLAHPLNQAVFDSESQSRSGTNQVRAGYTVLQPRTETLPTSANQSLFARIFVGDIGLDLYTHAVSDVYQDLFGEGIYVGKGIYDVAAFERSLAQRVPENALLSHDLFEGIQGRAGLVTDIVLFEDYPSSYLAHTRRLHRWIRGDWQLLPWLLSGNPYQDETQQSDLTLINHWKILDNLRRSLLPPALLALLIFGWIWLPGSPLFWSLLAVFTPAVPLFTSLATTIIQSMRQSKLGRLAPLIRRQTLRWLFSLAFLPYEALLSLNAIVRTLIRLTITRQHLLQWTTAAHTARIFSNIRKRLLLVWSQMLSALLLTLALGSLILWLNAPAFPVALPILLAWLFSPQLAYWISLPQTFEERLKSQALSQAQRQKLQTLARRTWLYFEQFVGPEDHWLPPDHFQEAPRGVVAHRTSPTNIGLLLLSVLSAYDFGYISTLDLALRLRNVFHSLVQLEQHRGHFLNWYDTRTLDPLPPRYVSTVDSGNLAACLITLRQGCLELIQRPVLRWQRWQGILDTLAVLGQVVDDIQSDASASAAADGVRNQLASIRNQILSAQSSPDQWPTLVAQLVEEKRPELEQRLVTLIEVHQPDMEAATLQSLRIWSARVRHTLAGMQRELNMLAPWLLYLQQPPALFQYADPESSLGQTWQELLDLLSPFSPIDQIVQTCITAQGLLSSLSELLDQASLPEMAGNPTGAILTASRTGEKVSSKEQAAARQWIKDVAADLDNVKQEATRLVDRYQDLIQRADDFVRAMDFNFLLDPQRSVFHIGYNVETGRLDNSYYDLLASEARIASLVAIAKDDVPQRHWLHLSRPLTQINGLRTLYSWSGTMFEYLMPPLMIRHYDNTLLDQSIRGAIKRQIDYGRHQGVPWGISESGFYHFDRNMNYQYRAFGVPGLGFKRGLGEDLVVTPYASVLALPFRPQEVLKNLDRFHELQMLGDYGFYEAIDFTGSRLPLGQEQAIVRSFMAHHQGMILLALTNYLQDSVMVDRFHADPRVQSVELLLQEQIPYAAPLEELPEEEASVVPAQSRIAAEPWPVPVRTPFPQVHLLSNGNYGVMVTNAGSGYSRYIQDASQGGNATDLTRWRADTTLDDWGTWVYVQDLQDHENSDIWSIGEQPTATAVDRREVTFYPHKIDLRCTTKKIALNMEITVPPQNDLEIRRLRLNNQSDRSRQLRLTSYAEVILAPQDTDRRHPAFNKLFIESEYLPQVNGLLFHRRPRSSEEEPLYLLHTLIVEPGLDVTGAYETDRARFVQRGGRLDSPAALQSFGRQSGGPDLPGTTGAVLDPIMALGQRVDLEAHESAEVAFMTLVAPSREEVIELAQHYRDWNRVKRAFNQARTQSELEMRQLEMTTPELERAQTLLSLLLYPHPALRSDPALLASNSKGQPALWQYAISGDYPILLVRIASEEETGLVRELLRAHNYWRNRNLKIDLVILNEKESGYAQEVQGQIRRLVSRMQGEEWLNRRGGIFVLRADTLSEADRVLVGTAARVVLDGAAGSLEQQLQNLYQPPTPLPTFVPRQIGQEEQEPTPPITRPDDLQFDNGLGGFSQDGREYIIYLERDQWTPAPWINVIANPHFGFWTSEAGGGYSWAINSGENRLTPWRNDPLRDPPGEALYLRDEETAEVWSPTPLPARESSPYLVRHGAGYTIFEHHSHGLEQKLRMFAAQDAPVKIIQLQLQNTWQRARRITATYYAEWVLGVNRDQMQQYIIPEYAQDHRALLARNPYNVEFSERVAFLAASQDIHGLTASRSEFLGHGGSLAQPAAMKRIGLSGTVEPGLDPCAALQVHVDLQPDESVSLFFLLGQGQDREQSLELVQQYQNPEQVEKSWKRVTGFWDDVLSTVAVQTPDPAMDVLLNRWLLYQDLSCRIWGRSALYQSSGAFGFRDQLQDVMALVHAAPELARQHILRAARHQFEAGDVLHWWHPPSGRGVRTRISDDLLWLPFVTAQYVRATGDHSILETEIPFVKGKPLEPDEEERYGHYEKTGQAFTLFEHCRRAIQHGSTSGPHDLPLIGAGDWNDGMNRVGIEGRGESVWLGWFLHATLTAFAAVCERIDKQEQARAYYDQATELGKALEEHGWDGAWYLRAYYDDGTPLGSHQNQECQIDSIAQSWAAISGAGDPVRVQEAMASVYKRLVRPDDRLLLLFTPPFDETPHDPGYIKGYPPGIRENGGQYTHAAIWAVWAWTEMGDGDRAQALFRLLNPIYHSDTPEKAQNYQVEPYVSAADVYSVPPYVGHGGWTWYTGSGGWLYRLGIEAILGLQRVGDALDIDPCLPSDWSDYSMSYRHGDTHYDIQVTNPDGINQGVQQVTLDDKVLSDGLIPLLEDGKRHTVRIVMGLKERQENETSSSDAELDARDRE